MKKTLFRLTMLLVTFLSLLSGAWGQTLTPVLRNV